MGGRLSWQNVVFYLVCKWARSRSNISGQQSQYCCCRPAEGGENAAKEWGGREWNGFVLYCIHKVSLQNVVFYLVCKWAMVGAASGWQGQCNVESCCWCSDWKGERGRKRTRRMEGRGLCKGDVEYQREEKGEGDKKRKGKALLNMKDQIILGWLGKRGGGGLLPQREEKEGVVRRVKSVLKSCNLLRLKFMLHFVVIRRLLCIPVFNIDQNHWLPCPFFAFFPSLFICSIHDSRPFPLLSVCCLLAYRFHAGCVNGFIAHS